MSVNAAALIPPPFKAAGDHINHQHVFAAVAGALGDVVAIAGITAQVAPQEMAVQPHHAVSERAVKVNPKTLALVRGREAKDFAVPTVGGDERAVVGIALGIKSAFDHKVMREMNAGPGAVIVIRGRSEEHTSELQSLRH